MDEQFFYDSLCLQSFVYLKLKMQTSRCLQSCANVNYSSYFSFPADVFNVKLEVILKTNNAKNARKVSLFSVKLKLYKPVFTASSSHCFIAKRYMILCKKRLDAMKHD